MKRVHPHEIVPLDWCADVKDLIVSRLDVAKQWNEIPSDYALAKRMGVTQSALINYRKGKTLPDEKTIAELCKLTGDDPHYMAARVQAERSKTKEARTLWESVARQLSTHQVAILAAFLLGFFGSEPSAHATAAQPEKPARLYIM